MKPSQIVKTGGHPLFASAAAYVFARRTEDVLMPRATCPRCARTTHPVEMLQVQLAVWRCARCVEDERVRAA